MSLGRTSDGGGSQINVMPIISALIAAGWPIDERTSLRKSIVAGIVLVQMRFGKGVITIRAEGESFAVLNYTNANRESTVLTPPPIGVTPAELAHTISLAGLDN